MVADRRLVCSSDDDHDLLPRTESCSLIPEACELEYLHFNGDKLLCSNDLYSLNNFVVNALKLQGKWLTPGGSTKQFKSSNGNTPGQRASQSCIAMFFKSGGGIRNFREKTGYE